MPAGSFAVTQLAVLRRRASRLWTEGYLAVSAARHVWVGLGVEGRCCYSEDLYCRGGGGGRMISVANTLWRLRGVGGLRVHQLQCCRHRLPLLCRAGPGSRVQGSF